MCMRRISSKSVRCLNRIRCSTCYVYNVNASPLMIYVLIEFHLTGIDFVWNGKILIKKKVSTTTATNNITKCDTGSYKMEKCRNINPKQTHTPNSVPFSLLFLSSSHSFRCHSDLYFICFFLLAVLLLQVQNRLTKNHHK